MPRKVPTASGPKVPTASNNETSIMTKKQRATKRKRQKKALYVRVVNLYRAAKLKTEWANADKNRQGEIKKSRQVNGNSYRHDHDPEDGEAIDWEAYHADKQVRTRNERLIAYKEYIKGIWEAEKKVLDETIISISNELKVDVPSFEDAWQVVYKNTTLELVEEEGAYPEKLSGV